MQKVTVQANANIALIKYWGKRDEKLFLPTKSSLSVTLSGLKTITTVCKTEKLKEDEIYINGYLAPHIVKENIVNFLDLFRNHYRIKVFLRLRLRMNFQQLQGLLAVRVVLQLLLMV